MDININIHNRKSLQDNSEYLLIKKEVEASDQFINPVMNDVQVLIKEEIDITDTFELDGTNQLNIKNNLFNSQVKAATSSIDTNSEKITKNIQTNLFCVKETKKNGSTKATKINFNKAKKSKYFYEVCLKCNTKQTRLNDTIAKTCQICKEKVAYQCTLCSIKPFQVVSTVYYHLFVEHDTKSSESIVCVRCKKTFSRSIIRKHMMVCKVEKCLECLFCPSKFHNKEYLRKHFISIHPQNDGFFYDLNKIVNDIVEKSNTKRIEAITIAATSFDGPEIKFRFPTRNCRKCDTIFSRASKNSNCKNCNKCEYKTGRNYYFCDLCIYKTKDKVQLLLHIKTHMEVDETDLLLNPKINDDEVIDLCDDPLSNMPSHETKRSERKRKDHYFSKKLIGAYCIKCKTQIRLKSFQRTYCHICNTRLIFRCRYCKVQNFELAEIRTHVLRNHAEKVYHCPGNCGISYSILEDYRKHLEYCGKRYRCKWCYSITKYKKSMIHHLQKCKTKKRINNVNSVTQNSTTTSAGYNSTVVKKKESFYCTKCNKSYRVKKAYLKHIERCLLIDYKFNCEHCVFKTNEKIEMVGHMSKHAFRLFKGINEFRCDNCTEVFKTLFKYCKHVELKKCY